MIKRLIASRIIFLLFPNLLIVSTVTAQRYVGSGHRAMEKRDLKGFNKIEASASVSVYVEQGDEFEVKVEADDNLVPLITTKVSGSVLQVSIKQNTDISRNSSMDVFVKMPQLKSVQLGGSSGLATKGKFSVDKLDIKTNGSGNILMNVEANEITAFTTGSGNIEFEGKATFIKAHTRGSGNLYFAKLVAEEVIIEVSGSGYAEVKQASSLAIKIDGSGNVYYDPKLSTSIDIKGGGSGKAIPR